MVEQGEALIFAKPPSLNLTVCIIDGRLLRAGSANFQPVRRDARCDRKLELAVQVKRLQPANPGFQEGKQTLLVEDGNAVAITVLLVLLSGLVMKARYTSLLPGVSCPFLSR
jgi:hypothetical protein